jgi:nitrate/nitrite transport system substrate-binding protein
VDKNPKAAKALDHGLCSGKRERWCHDPANVKEMCEIIAGREWLKIDPADLLGQNAG